MDQNLLINFDEPVKSEDVNKSFETPPIGVGAGHSFENLLDESPVAVPKDPFGSLVDFKSTTGNNLQPIETDPSIIVDPFAAHDDESPSKNPYLPPPLLPTNLIDINNLNPGALNLNTAYSPASVMTVPLNSSMTPLQSVQTSPSKSPNKKLSIIESRLNPIPPPLLSIHLVLPSRKWTDQTSFCNVPVVDNLTETVSKFFSHQPSNQRPQRISTTLEDAIKTPNAYESLINTNR